MNVVAFATIWISLLNLCPVQARGDDVEVRLDRYWGPWTAWSRCSASCGYGTAYRIRRCHAPPRQSRACAGLAKQYSICKFQECTDRNEDYRTRECAKNNDVYYGQRTYTWLPYINPLAPCELSCKSLGYGYYARFKKSVADYVICNEENTAMCVQGKCLRSGCDGVLGSDTEVDKCGVCGGLGNTCRDVSGILTRTHFDHHGYNIIAIIPIGACSINITEMRRSKNYLALSTPSGYIINGDMRLVSAGKYNGAGTTFSYSRASGPYCPGECLTAPGPLTTPLRVELLYFGRNPGVLYQYTVKHSGNVETSTQETRDGGRSNGRDQQSTGEDLPSIDDVRRIKHGKTPVYIPELETRRQRQQLEVSSQSSVPSSSSSSLSSFSRSSRNDIIPNNVEVSADGSSAKKNALSPEHDTYGYGQGRSRKKSASHRTRTHHQRHRSRQRPFIRIKSTYRDSAGNLRSKDKKNSNRRINLYDTSNSKPSIAYEPTKGQFYVKGENGTIQYKHYYHTNVHDDLGSVPMAATDTSDNVIANTVRYGRKPSWLDNSMRENRYEEFVGTTQYQPVSRAELPNTISASLNPQQAARPPPSNRVDSDLNSRYSGHDNRLSGTNERARLYSWRISGFTKCSETCGGGLQETRVVCVKRDSQFEVIEENCEPNLRPESTTVVCNNQPCDASWDLGRWSPCSVTCGRGLQKREISCSQRISPTLTISVSRDNCPHPWPQERQYCQLDPCFSWNVSDWGKCSTLCGFGQRSRSLTCTDTAGQEVSEQLCQQLRPSTVEICDMGSCAQGWFHTQWSKECSAQCGRGFYVRQVYCSAPDGLRLDESKCAEKDSKPKERKSCKVDKPCGGQWFAGPWSKCNATCGSDSYRQREVLCVKRHGKRINHVVKGHNCEKESRPSDTEFCGNLSTCEPQWYMTSWSKCSKLCDTGVRTREVKCLNHLLSPSPNCDKARKPSRRQSCNTQACEQKYAAFSEMPISTTQNQDLQMDRSPATKKDMSECEDQQTSKWCQVVSQARLCNYPHYKKLCCQTCRKLDPKPH